MTRGDAAEHAVEYSLFDWLRFALASVVVLSHAGAALMPMAADFAVCVFLALSGWLIGGILLRTRISGLPRFYFNRGMRIWIPYLAAIVLLYSLAAVVESFDRLDWQVLFYDVTFTHFWFIPKVPEVVSQMPLGGTGTHFWSISVEEQFYLFAPLLLILISRKYVLATWAVLSVVAGIVDYHYACITLGVLAILIRDRFGAWYLRHAAMACVAATAVVLMIAIFSRQDLYTLLAPVASTATVLAVAREGGRSSISKFLGGMSYPLYLNHWIGIFATNAMAKILPMVHGMHVLMAYASAVAVGAVAYIAIDKQILSYRQQAYTPGLGRIFTLTAYALLALGVIVHFAFLDPLGHIPS